MSTRRRVAKWAFDNLGYVVPDRRMDTEILPTLQQHSITHGYTSINAWIAALSTLRESHPHHTDFVNVLTINETSFFRQQRQLNTIVQHAKHMHTLLNRPIRIWCAGCSSGEEAYSLLFLLHANTVPCSIVATDIDHPSLTQARQGTHYPKYRTRNIPTQEVQRYFIVQEHTVDVHPAFRNQIQFRYHNLIAHPPPKPSRGGSIQHWDLIVCRNVFIYFSSEHVTQIVQNMHQVLETTGEIWLGVNDTLIGFEDFLDKQSRLGIRFFTHKKTVKNTSTPTTLQRSSLELIQTEIAPLIESEQWGNAQRKLTQIQAPSSIDKARLLVIQALLELREHNFTSAQRLLEQAKQETETEATIHYFLGVLAHKQRQTQIATTHFHTAVTQQRSFWPAHFLLGQYAHKQGNLRARTEHFTIVQRHLFNVSISPFFQSVFPDLIESVHNTPEDVQWMMTQYQSM